MSERNFRSSLRSNQNLSMCSNKPTKFRVVMKSKSGQLKQPVEARTKQLNKVKLIEPLKKIADQNIKQFVRQMRNRTQPTIQQNPSILNLQQPKMNLSILKQNQQQISRCMSVRQKNSSRLSNTKSIASLNTKTIEQIERKIDELIQQKMSKAHQLKNHHNKQSDQIDKQIFEILQFMHDDACFDNQNDQKLDGINKKINILEKVIAQSLAQSQMAKKYYYKAINNRKSKKPNLKDYKINLQYLKLKAKGLLNNSAPMSVHLQSTNRMSYQAPDRNSYPQKISKSSYQFKNQPIHRSTYGRDFLVYGSVPSYPYKQESSQVIPAITVANRGSSYQNQFTQKRIEKINIKQLDCYKDKYKNLQVPFIQLSTRTNKLYTADNKQQTKYGAYKFNQWQKTRYQKVRNKTQHSHYIRNLSTESKLNYKGEDNKIKSLIKHKNINDLKYKFKAELHA